MRSFRVSFSYENPLKKRFNEAFFESLPRTPGVYFMRSRASEILYVGKARCLRTRLMSYRNAQPGRVGENIIELLERVHSIDWEEHGSERGALDRELELIRAIVPRFNIAQAWEEDYLYIGLRRQYAGELEFRLTSRESDSSEFALHGCYSQRGRVKSGYSALLRLLHAATCRRPRFSFPARLARTSPAWTWSFELGEPATASRWELLVSEFLQGTSRALQGELVEALLANEKIPAFMRPGLQEDLEVLEQFRHACVKPRAKPGLKTHLISQEKMRTQVRKSVGRKRI